MENLPSRERIHIPPWKRKIIFKIAFFGVYAFLYSLDCKQHTVTLFPNYYLSLKLRTKQWPKRVVLYFLHIEMLGRKNTLPYAYHPCDWYIYPCQRMVDFFKWFIGKVFQHHKVPTSTIDEASRSSSSPLACYVFFVTPEPVVVGIFPATSKKRPENHRNLGDNSWFVVVVLLSLCEFCHGWKKEDIWSCLKHTLFD